MSSVVIPDAGTMDPASDESLYEVVDGVRIEERLMSAFETALASVLVSLLNQFARPGRLGVALMETLFQIGVGGRRLERRPDVAFIGQARWKLFKVTRENAWAVIPNLAVEIISPSNLWEEIEQKILEYFAAGVELVWVIAPANVRVHVYTSPTNVMILERTDELDGGKVVPGFRLSVGDLFDHLAMDEE